MTAPYEVAVGDVVELRKLHPCGSKVWTVTRIGADIGIKCRGCGRHVMITRRDFFKNTKRVLNHGAPVASHPPEDLDG
ncbi:MAG: DUF951 domain-containing protein [Chloroflexi bacterium]|nr:DUF951 domain-containing protein [Chloroflexota bacterium]